MSLKITVINSSPRQGGVTAHTSDAVVKILGVKAPDADTEVITTSNLKLTACIHCDSCVQTGECIFRAKDDAQVALDRINDSDLVIVMAPVYFAGVPGDFKSLIDRAQVFWNRQYERKEAPTTKIQRALMISTCGSKNKRMFEGNFLTLYYFFDSFGAKFKRDRDQLKLWQKEGPDDLTDEEIATIEAFAMEALLSIEGKFD